MRVIHRVFKAGFKQFITSRKCRRLCVRKSFSSSRDIAGGAIFAAVRPREVAGFAYGVDLDKMLAAGSCAGNPRKRARDNPLTFLYGDDLVDRDFVELLNRAARPSDLERLNPLAGAQAEVNSRIAG